jgi:hypothetical protein
MADTKEEVLQGAIIGLPRVADALAAVPADARPRALTAVEDSYRQSARDLGYDDGEAQNWVEAIMFRLRNEVDKRQSSEQKSQPDDGIVDSMSIPAA